MDNVRNLLDDGIERGIDEMFQVPADSPGYQAVTDRVAKLIKLKMEEKQADSEMQLKEKQLAESKKDRYLKLVTDGASIVLPLVVSWVWMGRGLRFEETGAFTSRTNQWLNGFLRIRK